MADKKVTVQVDTDVDDSKVKTLEQELNRIKQERLQLKIDANSAELKETEQRINGLKTFLENSKLQNIPLNINDEDIRKAEAELDALESKRLNLQMNVATDELAKAKSEEESLNGSAQFDIDVNDTAVQTAMTNLQQGINDVKAGFGEVASGFGEVMESAGRMEGTETFLSMNLGADEAKKKLSDIRSVTDALPGDDVVLQNLLSQAAIKQPGLVQKDFEQMGESAADYMAAMNNFGKSATETQQDLMNYILAGNTAEVALSPILANHIDDLKAANTPRERAVALQKALNEEHWGGVASQDTYNNKLQTFTDLIERGKINFGSMFLGVTEGAMDFIGSLDNATGGIIGMGAAFATEFGPGLFQGTQGLLSMGSSLSTMTKEGGILAGVMGKLGGAIGGAGGITGALSGAGSALMTFATGPVGIAIAVIAALAIAIYEVGKAFGWWSDIGSMFDAITTGLGEIWNSFMSNEYVIQIIGLIKQGLTDAWNAVVQFGSAIMTALTGSSGEFDILSWAINGLQTVLSVVGPIVVTYIQLMMNNFRAIYTLGQMVWPYLSAIISGAISAIRGVISGAMAIWTGLQSAWRNLQSTASSVFGAINGIVNSAGSAWHSFQSTVQGVIDGIMDKINALKDAASGLVGLVTGQGGLETSINTSSGAGGYTNVSQGNTIIFNMYGDVRDEKTIDDMIDAINNRVQFDALSNGITNNNEASGI